MIPIGVLNSSPIIVFSRIQRLDLIQQQCQKLYAPEAVAQEVGDVPDWIEVCSVERRELVGTLPSRIHFGEAEVLLLAHQMRAENPVLILDDRYARELAIQQGYRIIGSVGLLLRAKKRGLVPLVAPLLDAMTQSGFRVAPALIREALRLADET